ncbi:unnamed protein product, partial [Mesorhabditis belari]|uniref:Probable deoxycytidylate deaminase n=1 Tax=Mesorhabditis belari TaxID=2138241 RepID=A0AAF3FEJ5_9BILA
MSPPHQKPADPPSLPGTPVKLVEESEKRSDYLVWSDYFMALAILASKRSKDPTTQVGCVIVDRDNKVLGTGYNGMPIGCDDDEMPWGKGDMNPLRNKHAFVVHAEQNALINSLGKAEGCTLYTVLFPCNECAKIIVQHKIREVVYMLDRNTWEMEGARILFKKTGIIYKQFKTRLPSVTLSFDKDCYETDKRFDKHDA